MWAAGCPDPVSVPVHLAAEAPLGSLASRVAGIHGAACAGRGHGRGHGRGRARQMGALRELSGRGQADVVSAWGWGVARSQPP